MSQETPGLLPQSLSSYHLHLWSSALPDHEGRPTTISCSSASPPARAESQTLLKKKANLEPKESILSPREIYGGIQDRCLSGQVVASTVQDIELGRSEVAWNFIVRFHC